MDYFTDWWDTLGLLNFRPSNKLSALYRETSELHRAGHPPMNVTEGTEGYGPSSRCGLCVRVILMGPHTDHRKNDYMLFNKTFLQPFLCIRYWTMKKKKGEFSTLNVSWTHSIRFPEWCAPYTSPSQCGIQKLWRFRVWEKKVEFNFGNLRLRARKTCSVSRWKGLAWKSGEEYGSIRLFISSLLIKQPCPIDVSQIWNSEFSNSYV